MADNLPEDEFGISEDKLREYLKSSPKDPDYDALREKNKRFSSSPTRDELIEMIEKVHQSVSKLDEGIDSRTERCISLLERLSDACVAQTSVLAEHERSIEQLQRLIKKNKNTIFSLTCLTLLSMSFSLVIVLFMATRP